MKKLPVLLIGLLLAVLLVACGDNTATTGPATGATAAASPTMAMSMTTPAMTTATMTTPAMTTAAMMTTPAMTTMAPTSMNSMTTMPSMTMTPGMTMTMGNMTTSVAMTTSASSTTSAAAATGTMMVSIDNFSFSPESLTVPVGTKVIWTNKDSTEHTVTSDTGTMLKSDLIPQNKTFEYTFTQPGTYTYHCQPHPFMTGTIIVK